MTELVPLLSNEVWIIIPAIINVVFVMLSLYRYEEIGFCCCKCDSVYCWECVPEMCEICQVEYIDFCHNCERSYIKKIETLAEETINYATLPKKDDY